MIRLAPLILLALTVTAQAGHCDRATGIGVWPQTAMTPYGETRGCVFHRWPTGDRLAQNMSQMGNASAARQAAIDARNAAKCQATGQPEDCQGWVCGSYGCVKPSR